MIPRGFPSPSSFLSRKQLFFPIRTTIIPTNSLPPPRCDFRSAVVNNKPLNLPTAQRGGRRSFPYPPPHHRSHSRRRRRAVPKSPKNMIFQIPPLPIKSGPNIIGAERITFRPSPGSGQKAIFHRCAAARKSFPENASTKRGGIPNFKTAEKLFPLAALRRLCSTPSSAICIIYVFLEIMS